MKVKFCNQKLWRGFIKIVSVVTSILSFLLTVVDIKQRTRLIISAIVLAVLSIVFLIMWYLANKKVEQKLKINATDVIIKYGDIFEQSGVKVIAFNEYFDTQVDDNVIAANSFNGIFINHIIFM